MGRGGGGGDRESGEFNNNQICNPVRFVFIENVYTSYIYVIKYILLVLSIKKKKKKKNRQTYYTLNVLIVLFGILATMGVYDGLLRAAMYKCRWPVTISSLNSHVYMHVYAYIKI